MADVAGDTDARHAASLGRGYLFRFQEHDCSGYRVPAIVISPWVA